MALALRNNTAFTCQPIPLTARNGATVLRLVVKGGFTIRTDGSLVLSDVQPDIVLEDKYWGDPGASSIRYESDVILEKPYTDLIVNGHAYAPNGEPDTEVEVAVGYRGRLVKRLLVIGDRFWRSGPRGWRMSSPQPFVKLPLIYERAFGGTDEHGSEARNRSGTGYTSALDSRFEGTPAPNVEFADQLISSVADRPAPAGLGVISKHWLPRLSYAGTYDDVWLDKQFPLLPRDFDPRFFQSTPQDQWVERPQGGEEIALKGMTPNGLLRFRLPSCPVHAQFRYRDRTENTVMDLDTILVEPDERRVGMIWRTTADIHGDPFKLLEMTVGLPEERAADCGCG